MKLSSSCLSEGRRRRSRQIGGLRVEVLEGNLSKNQTTGEVKIREVTFELLREVGFRQGQKLSQDSRDFPQLDNSCFPRQGISQKRMVRARRSG